MQSQTSQTSQTDYEFTDRRDQLTKAGIRLYPHVMTSRHDRITLGMFHTRYDDRLGERGTTLETESCVVTGRITQIRQHGDKLAFIMLSDQTGELQLVLQQQHYQADVPSLATLLGVLEEQDIVSVYGFPCRTNPKGGGTSMESMMVRSLELLTPAMRRMTGYRLVDPERRYRERALDFFVNPDCRRPIIERARIIHAIRSFFVDMNLLEVETPVLGMQAGGAAARPFITRHNALKMDMFMRVAPELFLKMLVVGGFDSNGVFEIGKNFRNEDMDATHNPEFTAIEAYLAFHDYQDLMDMTERLFERILRSLQRENVIVVGEQKIDFTRPWARISIIDELHKQHAASEAGGTFPADNELESEEANSFFSSWCVYEKIECGAPRTTARLIDKLVGHYIEPRCVNPTFLIEHPQLMSPLAKYHRSRPGLTERFELFINGFEICNAFTELNDPFVQRRLFQDQAKEAAQGDDEAMPPDEIFCRALEYGLPPTAGWGMGIDRLVMLLTNQPTIRDVLCFPAMKPLPLSAYVKAPIAGGADP